MNQTTYSFTEEFAKLNPAQKQAVETIDGSVLVVAGPGTGKTQILAARIANILDKTDAKPDNILCLTFTEAGVVAMRNRLLKFIGSEAYKVNIHTFHSFCNRVIQENTDYFGITEIDPIGEMEQINLLQHLADSLKNDNPLKRLRGDIYYEIKQGSFQKLFSLMKSENLSVEDIEKGVEEYLTSLESDPNFLYQKNYTTKAGKKYVKGDLKENKIEEERVKFAKTILAAKEFVNYEALKKAKGFYDFDDMIHWVLKAFQNNPDLLLSYQERFQFVLVDEYQDTNGAQNEIFKLLISYWENPNAFVVGDDDQSIFRFQGANLGNIVDFYQSIICKSFPNIEERKKRVIVMTNNYRSSQKILDTAKASIGRNKERLIHQLNELGLDKALIASGPLSDKESPTPKVVAYYNATHEMLDIAMQIESLHEQKVNLNDIAVIYLKHKQSEEILQYLNQKDIPVRTKRKINILETTFTGQLLDVLKYIADEIKIPHSREDLLFKMFHFDFFGLDSLQVARLAFDLREIRYKNPKATWREALHETQVVLDAATIEKLKHWSIIIEKWFRDVQNMPFQLFFQQIINDLSLLPFIMQHNEKVWLLQELKTLFDFIKNENKKNAKLNIQAFLDLLSNMREFRISLDYTKSTYAESAVNFTTAHGAKGLEFKYVYILGTSSEVWDKIMSARGFRLPNNLFQKATKESDIEERRRLFYVAMTRAEQYLQVSYAHVKQNGTNDLASSFVTELLEDGTTSFEEKHFTDNPVIEFTLQQLALPKTTDKRIIEASYLAERLESYAMSVTHLNNYLKCPLRFYYQNFLQVPSAKNIHMAFGSAIHNALEQFFKKMLIDKAFPSKDQLLEFAEHKMYGQEDSFTKKEYKQRLDYIKAFLPKYYDNYIDSWNTNVKLEKRLYGVLGDIELNGALDKMEFDQNKVVIVDYKTGKHSNAKKKLSGPSKKDLKGKEPTHEQKYGGDYWRQAVFYHILINNNKDIGQQHWEYDRTEFDFVEPDTKTGIFHKEKVLISPEDVAIVKQQITETYKGIKSLDFKGCGKDDCEWCEMEDH